MLVIRFSSLGDVALTIPVFKTLEAALPDHTFYLLTRPAFKELFTECGNVKVLTADVDHKYKGLFGLNKLANLISNHDFETTIDLHDVLRTKMLRLLLKVKGYDIEIFDKGRQEKSELIKIHDQSKKLKHTCQRYLDAFSSLQPNLKVIKGPWLHPKTTDHLTTLFQSNNANNNKIGFAFFSKHESKEWGISKSEALLEKLSIHSITPICFAFGERERGIARSWKDKHANLHIIDERVPLSTQLAIMKELDVLVSMDSANMHLASLVGTKVVSIWGATHPNMGFSPLENKDGILIAPVEQTPWQPLSVYGKLRGEKSTALARKGMDLISVDLVYGKVMELLEQNDQYQI